MALSLESMLELVSKTDAWVLVMYHKDGVNERDVTMDPRHAEVLKAVDEVRVQHCRGDYFGEVVAHPEWVLEDICVGAFEF